MFLRRGDLLLPCLLGILRMDKAFDVQESSLKEVSVKIPTNAKSLNEDDTVSKVVHERMKEDVAHYLVKMLAQELKPVITEVGRALVDEDQRVEDLKDIIKGHEEKIACLERMIIDLKQLLRYDQAKDFAFTVGNTSEQADHVAHSIVTQGKTDS